MPRVYPHPTPDDVSLAKVLFALSDPNRLAMVRLLATGASVNSIDLAPDMPKSTLTHHTGTLRKAGITTTRPEGRNCWITLRRDLLDTKFPGLLDTILRQVPDT
ncbi:ArsR/SmtB family transcription factor [Larsenimonas salina]|uniref:ArsR/SmtB family transcription factor n=1 Tax=Larsenimonas salina TaxID=1295565 RepID=UPI002073ACC8|nr:helix-turn-helix domain-containing protein [Larsenimonas salina]MCM5704526.1 helix-turn-helix domain-containing protein [Larsenimonas salina]